MRTLILGLMVLVLGALALRAGPQSLHPVADRPSALHGLGSALVDAGPLHLLPVRVTGLVQKAFQRSIGPFDSAVILALILLEAAVVGVVLQLTLADRSFGMVVNSLLALAGAWSAMLFYDLRPDADALSDLDALVTRGLVASVAAPAALILIRAFADADADTFLAGGDTRTGAATRGLIARFKALARAAARRLSKGPSRDRIRSAVDRRKS